MNLPVSHTHLSFYQASGVIRTRSLVICWGKQADGYGGEGRNKRWGRWHYLRRYDIEPVITLSGERWLVYSGQEGHEASV